MEKIDNANIAEYLKPQKIIETPNYADWIIAFSRKHKKFSDDPSYIYYDISSEDKENLKKLSTFISALEYLCLVQNVKINSSYIYEDMTNQIVIYFSYKGRNFAAVKETNKMVTCFISNRHKNDKNKHKYLKLDKFF